MSFGYATFDADHDGSVGDQMAEKRIDPLARFRQHRSPHTVEHNPLPAKAKASAPSHGDVHGHLDAAKSAPSDDEKRTHVFRALTALNRRAKAFPKTAMPDMGAS